MTLGELYDKLNELHKCEIAAEEARGRLIFNGFQPGRLTAKFEAELREAEDRITKLRELRIIFPTQS